MTREVDLKQYLPEVVSDVYELMELADTENRELNQLFQEGDERFFDSFIINASPKGLKRYEVMLGIPVNASASPEERRNNILMKWNRQLPYTMRRLMEQLILWAGAGGFTVSTGQLQEYILGICLIDKTLPLLRNVKQSVEQMIPANLVLDFSGLYPAEMLIPIRYENALSLRAEFYPRYNMAHHFLEGMHCLDGSKPLNGYASDEVLDFYPVKLTIGGQISAIREASAELTVWAEAEAESKCDTVLSLLTNAAEAVEMAAKAEYVFDCRVFVGAECHLAVEDHLRYLDGAGYLDGEKLLNADVYAFHL